MKNRNKEWGERNKTTAEDQRLKGMVKKIEEILHNGDET